MSRQKKISNEIKKEKEKTIKARQEPLKQKVLGKLREIPFIVAAAAFVGIDRSTIYRWRKEDRAFDREITLAQGRGREKYNDIIESVLLKKAQGGDMSAIAMWLKHNHTIYANRLILKYEDVELSREEEAKILKVLREWSGTGKITTQFSPNLNERGIKGDK